jgi:predicted nucleic acid-binding protein
VLVGDLPSVFETLDDVDMSVDDPSNDFTMKEVNNDQLVSPQKSFSKPVSKRKHTAAVTSE